MKPSERGQSSEQPQADKSERVRKAIGEMLSSEQRGIEPDEGDAPGTLAEREPVPCTGTTPAEIAAQKRLGEIERHVGALVEDPELEQAGSSLEHKKG